MYTPPSRPAAGLFSSPRVILWCVAIWLTGMLTFEYYDRVETPSMEKRIALHTTMLKGEAPDPYRYRVLMPHTADLLARAIQHTPIASGRPLLAGQAFSQGAFAASYCLLNGLAFFVMFLSIGDLLERLYPHHLALLGIVLSALLVNFTFRDHYYHPWSIAEGAIFALGMLLIHTDSRKKLFVLALVGLLNRETSIFLVLAYLSTTLPWTARMSDWTRSLRTPRVQAAAATVAAWVAGFFGLHALIGYKPATFFLETAIHGNSARFSYAVLINLVLLSLLIPFIVRGVFLAPTLIRRSVIVLPAYFALLIVIGYWWEIRYWISVIPILVPALIAAIPGSARVEDDPAALPLEAERHMLQL